MEVEEGFGSDGAAAAEHSAITKAPSLVYVDDYSDKRAHRRAGDLFLIQ